jgi:hypothetical protein
MLNPINPTPRILAHNTIPNLSRKLRRRLTPHARLAVKYNLLPRLRLRQPKPILEFFFVQEEGVGLRLYGQIDGRRNVSCGEFVGFAYVDEMCFGGGVEGEVFYLCT